MKLGQRHKGHKGQAVWLAWILKEEGPRRGLLRDCEIFANLRLKLYSSPRVVEYR